MERSPRHPRLSRLARHWKWARPIAGLALFAGVAALVWGELGALDWPQIQAELSQTDRAVLALAGLAVLANVAAMGLYDAACFPRAPRLGFLTRWGIGSLCFAWSNFLTLGPIGGPALRVLVYTRRGLAAGTIARGLIVQYIGFVSALLAWVAAMAAPLPVGSLGARIALAAALSAVLSLVLRAAAVRVLRRFDALPVTVEALEQARAVRIGFVGFLDWGCSLACFWLIAKAAGLALDPFLTARTFFGGHLAGMASMLPGGIGSADATWLLSLTEAGFEADESAATILLFRLIFYVAPWAVAAVVTFAIASRTRSDRAWRPNIVAAATAVGAAFFLITAAAPTGLDPAAGGVRSAPLLEAAHLTTVLSASALAVLSLRLRRRSRSGMRWSALFLLLCAAAHLALGGDTEEALVCIALLAGLLLARKDLTLPAPAVPGPWATAAILAGALALHLGIGVTAHTDASHDAYPLLTFASRAEFPRFLRGAIALAIAIPLGALLSLRLSRAARRSGPGGPTTQPPPS